MKKTLTDEPRMGRPILANVDPVESLSYHPLVQLRLKLKISQEELGEKLGVSRPTVSRYERGDNHPKGLILKEINRMLVEQGLPEMYLK